MKQKSNKHDNYEILNLLGYGLAKFDNDFIKEFNFNTKTAFFEYFKEVGLVKTPSVVKNRMDLFDPFFPNNRKGWWQKGDTYIHRKILIDNLFGKENVEEFANIVKLFLKDKYGINNLHKQIKPILKSRYKLMQETGMEAELFFLNNYKQIHKFKYGILEDARLYGDGYDFQIDVKKDIFLTEIKGIRDNVGNFRLTEKEYLKAKEYQENYIIIAVLNLNSKPMFSTVSNPLQKLRFKEKVIKRKDTIEYQLEGTIC